MKNRNKSTIQKEHTKRQRMCWNISTLENKIEFCVCRVLPPLAVYPVCFILWVNTMRCVRFAFKPNTTRYISCIKRIMNKKEIGVKAKISEKETARLVVATKTWNTLWLSLSHIHHNPQCACLVRSFVPSSNDLVTSVINTHKTYIQLQRTERSRLNQPIHSISMQPTHQSKYVCVVRVLSSVLFHLYTLRISYFVFGAVWNCNLTIPPV